MTGVQTCALPICFPVTIRVVAEEKSAAESSAGTTSSASATSE